MGGWELSIGIYTGVLFGICTDKYNDGFRHCIYIPFLFISLDTYYD